MTAYVVDTNVPVVANGDHPAAGAACVQACLLVLQEVVKHGTLVLDSGPLILGEYSQNLAWAGQPGPGDAFFKWAWDNQGHAERCERVDITPVNGSFAEFPDASDLRGFHDDDRKFVAVARASQGNPDILNAVDSDWWFFREALARCGVRLRFLCPDQFRAVPPMLPG